MKIIVFLVLISTALAAAAQAETTAENSPEKTAVTAVDRAFEAAYTKADAKAVADFFTDDAHYTSDDGRTFDGRAAIEQNVRAAFARNSGTKLAIMLDSVRLLAPDVL
ncbi:MAG: SgcJ/EcaC family oxidoreductase, partial [Candidatus Udaeobacter sp.]